MATKEVRFIVITGLRNGFQPMMNLGFLPNLEEKDHRHQEVTLTFDDSGRVEDRSVYPKANPDSPSLFTREMKGVYLPVRHGEGHSFRGINPFKGSCRRDG